MPHNLAIKYYLMTVAPSMYVTMRDFAASPDQVEGIGRIFGMQVVANPSLPESMAILRGEHDMAILNLWTGEIRELRIPGS